LYLKTVNAKCALKVTKKTVVGNIVMLNKNQDVVLRLQIKTNIFAKKNNDRPV